MEKLYTIKECAEVLSVSVRTIYRWIDEGRIPYIQLSEHVYRFNRDDLIAWVTERTNK